VKNLHIIIAIICILAAYKWGDWRNWQKYHTTILFFSLGNLLYVYLTAGCYLWRLTQSILPSPALTEFLYTFIVFPATILLFLGNFPQSKWDRVLHVLKWILIYSAVEYLFTVTGNVEYQNGWSLYWSILFNVVMFPILAIHHKRPLLAYLLSAPVCIFVLWFFDIPINIPIEDRN